MKRTAKLIFITAIGTSLLALSACGSNDSSSGTGGTAGSGGASGTGGTSGSGGASGTGGTSGSGGASGTGGTSGSDGGGGSAGSDGGSMPAPPTLGTQIDRFGRPAINTALDHTFDPSASTKGTAKDAYNAAADPSTWVASFKTEVAKNLAILDSLDTNCGNGLLANGTAAGAYDSLATVLADDRMIIDTSKATCGYLGVELGAGTCGGRKLDDDVIDASYSELAAGVSSGVTDGVDANDSAFSTTFPYLAAPH